MSSIVSAILAYKRALLSREADAMRALAMRWQGVMSGIDGDMHALLKKIDAIRAKGETVSAWMLRKEQRYKALLQQASTQYVKYADYTQQITKAVSRQSAKQGGIDTIDLLRKNEISIDWDRIDTSAVEKMAGIMADGSPVRDVMMRRFPAQWASVEQQIVAGMGRGLSPAEIAKRMQDILCGALNNALRIVRTEQLRAYREATRDSYRQSGVVSGYKRMASKDTRTCAACLAADGKQYTLTTPLIDHPNGRCVLVPIIKGLPPPQWTQGPEWFDKLEPEEQRDILGPGKYDAWAQGKFDFEQLAKLQNDPTWGKQITVAPLRDLIA